MWSSDTARLLQGLQHAALMAAGEGQDQTACRQRCVSHTHSDPALPVTARYALSGDHARRCMTSRPAREQICSRALGHCTPTMMHGQCQSGDASSAWDGKVCKVECYDRHALCQPPPADSGVLTPAATSQTAKPGTAGLALASRWPDGLQASAVTRDRDVRNVMLASAETLLRVQRHRSACPGWHHAQAWGGLYRIRSSRSIGLQGLPPDAQVDGTY